MVDVALVFGLLAFIFYQVSILTPYKIQAIYARNPSFIPDCLFGFIWIIIYTCIFFSGYEAFRSDAHNDYLVPMLTLFIINMFLNKMWTRFFFDDESPRMALAVVIGILLTGIAVVILMGLTGLWLSLGLFAAYLLWVAIAMILNCQWVCKGEGENGDILPTQMKVPQPASRRMRTLPPKLPYRGLLKCLIFK